MGASASVGKDGVDTVNDEHIEQFNLDESSTVILAYTKLISEFNCLWFILFLSFLSLIVDVSIAGWYVRKRDVYEIPESWRSCTYFGKQYRKAGLHEISQIGICRRAIMVLYGEQIFPTVCTRTHPQSTRENINWNYPIYPPFLTEYVRFFRLSTT